MLGTMGAEITIRKVVEAGQLDLALGYVKSTYQRKFRTSPEHIWPDCLVASTGQDIVGVLAMQFSEREEPFEVERHFLWGDSVLVHPRAKFVSLGRWVAAHPGTGRALMFAAVKTAMALGRTHSLSCSKLNVAEFVRRSYGLRFNTWGLQVNQGNIPVEDRHYFLERPAPVVCTGALRQWYDALEPTIPSSFRIYI